MVNLSVKVVEIVKIIIFYVYKNIVIE